MAPIGKPAYHGLGAIFERDMEQIAQGCLYGIPVLFAPHFRSLNVDTI